MTSKIVQNLTFKFYVNPNKIAAHIVAGFYSQGCKLLTTDTENKTREVVFFQNEHNSFEAKIYLENLRLSDSSMTSLVSKGTVVPRRLVSQKVKTVNLKKTTKETFRVF